MNHRYILILFFVLTISKLIQAQPFFPGDDHIYRTDSMPRVDITINEDTLAWIYDNVDSEIEFRARFLFSVGSASDTIEEIGFRLRGNTSLHSQKKSFKISFNSYQQGRKYHGVEKMNLNGEHNDPSIIRSHLTWNLFADLMVPAPRSNHVNVFINNRFYGLYINVEHVDEEFVESRFNNQFGNLYKCLYPANLSYLGTNPSDYKNNGYELKTNEEKDDYSDLINFIHTLDNSTPAQLPEKIEPIFNVNNYLRYLAVEIFSGHWDGYSFNKNNYYLYNNAFTGKFEFIPYDTDNTFGIDWFNIDWATRDIYHWWPDWEDRQLTSKIISNPIYKDRFSFFMNELITKQANADTYFAEIDAIKSKITSSAEADIYRTLDYGWTINDFHRSYTEKLGNHVKYGIKPYISARINSIKNQLVVNPIAPIVSNVYHNFPSLSEAFKLKAAIVDDEESPTAMVYYRVNEGATTALPMIFQSGELFTASLPAINQPGTVYYYIIATDASSKTTREPSFGEYSLKIGISDATLSINEFMTGNTHTIIDNYGEAADWIEIKNTGQQPVSLHNKYLTDDLTNTTKWSFPDITLEPGAFYLVWADDDAKQGPNHTNFKLSQNGESLGIFDSFETNYAAIETFSFTPQDDDISYGKNSTGQHVQQNFITPGGENESADVSYITFHYNMNKQIQEGKFNSLTDFIDIAGTFNNWKGNETIYDGNQDGIYSISLFGFTANETIEYKARINADWGTAEFPELGGDGNRIYQVLSGANIVGHWYNDEKTGIASIKNQPVLSIFPNPVNNQFVTIECPSIINKLTIYNLNGSEVFTNTYSAKTIQLEQNFESGIYLIQIVSNTTIFRSKVIIQ